MRIEVNPQNSQKLEPKKTGSSHLKGIITGDPVPPPTFRVQSLVKSFKIKPPKQVLLSNRGKTLTGNVELIQILNRLGHGLSYSQLEENDTALYMLRENGSCN